MSNHPRRHLTVFCRCDGCGAISPSLQDQKQARQLAFFMGWRWARGGTLHLCPLCVEQAKIQHGDRATDLIHL